MKTGDHKHKVLFIIFGATGDLTKRKLIPGIYNLLKNKRLGDFHVLGTSRRSLTPEQLVNSAKQYIEKPKTEILTKIKNNSSYVQLDFSKSEDFPNLKNKIQELEKKEGKTLDKIFYMATSPNFFEPIAKGIKEIGIAREKNCFTRIIFEKPFGLDLKSSRDLNKSVRKIFDEDQIYRIDHYLGKELVGNISIVRFSNTFLEPIWNNKYVESIQIILDENIGIEERGPFYDRYGAIKDVVQNHMLQLLALLTMEQPKLLSGEPMRDKKAELLKHVKVVDTLAGQYEGYKKEDRINPKSQTETFAAMKLEINNKRWKGVPIFFKTGKLLDKKTTKIIVNFKKTKCLFEKVCPSEGDSLEIRIYPDEGIALNLNVKVPGKIESKLVKMDFCHSCVFGPDTPEGYENLFADVIRGDQSVFTRDDEIDRQWQITEEIKRGKVYTYKKGSKGPKELQDFNKKHKIKWVQ